MRLPLLTLLLCAVTMVTARVVIPATPGDDEMQAPQLVRPQQCNTVEDAPVLDFTRPVQFAWMPCTNPSGAPVRVTYSLAFYRLMGMEPMDAVRKLKPIVVVNNLMAPQHVYNKPVTERIGRFVDGEPYAMVVKASVQSMDGRPVRIANGGASAYTVFMVSDSQQRCDSIQ